MPIYQLECKKCEKQWEEFCMFYNTDSRFKKIKCPGCKSKSKRQILGEVNFNFSNPIGTDRWVSDSTGHDYRYQWNKPNMRAQREAAEDASHMGTSPYRDIDDISSGKNFGKVK